MNQENIIHLPCRSITPGDNDRKEFDHAALRKLAGSIQENGLAQPITVRPINKEVDHAGLWDQAGNCKICGEAGRCPHQFQYEVVAGERRFRAVSFLLGWEEIPCIVRDLTDEQAAAIMLVENTSRADLNPIEQAEAFEKRRSQYGWSVEYIAEVAGVSVDTVKRRLDLLKLVAEAQRLIVVGQLKLGYAEALVHLDTNRQRIALRILAKSDAVSLPQFRQIVGELRCEQDQEALFSLENFWVNQVQLPAEYSPRRGKHAITCAPLNPDLPRVEIEGRDNTSAIIERYIARLITEGKRGEAAAIGNVYDALVRGNFLAVPEAPILPGLIENL